MLHFLFLQQKEKELEDLKKEKRRREELERQLEQEKHNEDLLEQSLTEEKQKLQDLERTLSEERLKRIEAEKILEKKQKAEEEEKHKFVEEKKRLGSTRSSTGASIRRRVPSYVSFAYVIFSLYFYSMKTYVLQGVPKKVTKF